MTSIDYLNGIPKSIQYKNLVNKNYFKNSFYLLKSGENGIVGSTYYIEGGDWVLRIISYDASTEILIGTPDLGGSKFEFLAIPINECINNRYIHGNTELDNAHLKILNELKLREE